MLSKSIELDSVLDWNDFKCINAISEKWLGHMCFVRPQLKDS